MTMNLRDILKITGWKFMYGEEEVSIYVSMQVTIVVNIQALNAIVCRVYLWYSPTSKLVGVRRRNRS